MATDIKLIVKGVADFSAVETAITKIQSKDIKINIKGDTKTITEVTKGVNSFGNKITQTETKVQKLGTTTQNATNTITTGMNKADKATQSVGQRFADTTLKVAKFAASTALIGAFTAAISGAFQAVKEFDDALTEYKKVSDLSGDSLDNYTKKLGEMGAEVGRSRAQMVEAATEFKKSGFSDEDSATLARVAAMFQNVADSELSAGDSANFITSQLKAFNVEASNAEHIIDAVNEVSNNFAVSSTDISSALSKTSSAMGVLGNSYEETIGLVTAGVEIMQNQSGKVARGLRTIGNNFANAANQADSFKIKVNGATKEISLYDEETNDMESTFGIFENLSQYWNEMTKAEQQSVAIAYAGKNQFEVFTAVMNNFAQAQKATETALNSEGSAAKENAKAMESLQLRLQNLAAQAKELALNIISSDLVGSLIDLGSQVLKFANSDLGQLITTIGLATSGVLLFNKALTAIKGLQGANFLGDTINALSSMTKGSQAASSALTFMYSGFTKTIATLAPMTAGLAGIVAILKVVKDYMNRTSDAVSVYENITSEIQKNQAEIETLESKGNSLNETEKVRLAYLREQTAELEKQKNSSNQDIIDSVLLEGVSGGIFDSDDEKAEAEYENIKKLIDVKMSYFDENQKLIDQMKEEPSLYEENTKEIDKNMEGVKALIDEYDDVYDALKRKKDSNEELTESENKLYDALDNLITKYREQSEVVEESTKTEYEKRIEKIATAYNDMNEAISGAKQSASSLATALSEVDNEGDALSQYGTLIKNALEDAENTVDGTKLFWETAEGVLGEDFLNSINWNFDKAKSKMQELQNTAEVSAESTSYFAEMLYEHASELNEIGVTVQKTGDSIDFSGLNSSNLDSAAEILGVSSDYLAAMLDSAQRFADIDLYDAEGLKRAIDNLGEYGTLTNEAENKTYVFSKALKDATEASGKDWQEVKEAVEETGYSLIDLDGDASALANQLVELSSAFGSVNDGVVQLNVETVATQLMNLGYTADEAKAKIAELGQSDSVELTINNKIVAQDEASAKIDEVYQSNSKLDKEEANPKIKVNASSAKSEIKTVETLLSGLPTVKTVYIKAQKIGNFDVKAEGGEAKGGTTLVNEEGAELIQSGDSAYIANNGYPTLVNLKKGDYVFTAPQTKDILNGKSIKGRIQSRAQGTIKLPSGSSRYSSSSSNKSSSSKSNSSSNSSSSNSDVRDKALKELDAYIKKQTEAYQRMEITASKYYSNIEKMGRKYWKSGKIELDDYQDYNSQAVDEIFDEINWRYDNGKISAQEYYNQLKKYAKKFYKNGKITYAEYRDYIMDAQEAIAEHEKEMQEKAIEYLENALKKKEELIQKSIDKQQGILDALDFYADEQQRLIDDQIDSYNEQIDALNAQLDAIDEQNEALERQNELIQLRQNLEDAYKQKIRVYDESLGWVYVSDPRKVEEAQNALDDFNREEETNEEKKAIQAQIDAIEGKIETLEDEKQAWQDLVDEQARQLQRAEIELQNNATIEETIFQGKAETMENYKNSYVAAINAMIAAEKELLAVQQQAAALEDSVSDNPTNDEVAKWNANILDKTSSFKNEPYYAIDSEGKIHYSTISQERADGIAAGTIKPKATGSVSLPSSGLYNIDELGAEAIIPPSGRIVDLPMGAGVIPSDMTKNLMDIGKYSMSQLMSLFGNKSESNVSSSNIDNSKKIVIQNLEVKSNSANDFVRQLQNLAITSK